MVKMVLAFLVAFTTSAFAAAPDTLAGKVYRSYLLFSGVTNAGESTIVFGRDGRYVQLKNALGTVEKPGPPESLPEVHWGAITTPPPDGSYQYAKTGENTASLTMIPDGGGASSSVTLHFASSSTGSTSLNGLSGLGGQYFYLTDLATQAAAPIANVSLRGRVTEGRPLVMGFVVPGDTEREVLIRVIGSSLASFGVSGAWASSSLQLYKGPAPVFGETFRFPFWSDAPRGLVPNVSSSPEAGLRKIFDYVGAFALPSGSRDSAIVIRLSPGSYSVMAAAAAGDPGGEALIELYSLP